MKIRTIIFLAAFIALGAASPYFVDEPISAQGGTSLYFLTSQGTLSTGGAYTHNQGQFFRIVEGTPQPSPSPTATPPCVPSPGAPGGTIFFGTYLLSNNENGNFILSVQDTDRAATGTGAPMNIPQNPTVVEMGPLTLTLQINMATDIGTGTISFTSSAGAITGTVDIFTSIDFPPTDPVVCGTPTPTPTPASSPTPTPTPTPAASPTPTPTPGATATITGRVFTPTNLALRNAVVTLINSQNVRQTATTSSFGVYNFANVPTGNYTLTVFSKRYRFTPNIFTLTGNTTIDFVGLE